MSSGASLCITARFLFREQTPYVVSSRSSRRRVVTNGPVGVHRGAMRTRGGLAGIVDRHGAPELPPGGMRLVSRSPARIRPPSAGSNRHDPREALRTDGRWRRRDRRRGDRQRAMAVPALRSTTTRMAWARGPSLRAFRHYGLNIVRRHLHVVARTVAIQAQKGSPWQCRDPPLSERMR